MKEIKRRYWPLLWPFWSTERSRSLSTPLLIPPFLMLLFAFRSDSLPLKYVTFNLNQKIIILMPSTNDSPFNSNYSGCKTTSLLKFVDLCTTSLALHMPYDINYGSGDKCERITTIYASLSACSVFGTLPTVKPWNHGKSLLRLHRGPARDI